MIIYGAGMAGLLAGQMLRRFRPQIREAQSSLPNNHHAVLRFRSDVVARATGIPFTKVMVQKAIMRHVAPSGFAMQTVCTLRDANLYAHKVLGVLRADRSIQNLAPAERYIAPPDFIAQLAEGLDIVYDCAFTGPITDGPVISTIPLPAMLRLVGALSPEETAPFTSRAISTLVLEVSHPEAYLYQTLYYPDPAVPWYRATFTRNRLQIEYADNAQAELEEEGDLLVDVRQVLSHFGFPSQTEFELLRSRDGHLLHRQPYGKLLPASDERQRKSWILQLTDAHGIYSLGRFATWRQLLLDDVVQDVGVIEQFITQRDRYQRQLHGHRI